MMEAENQKQSSLGEEEAIEASISVTEDDQDKTESTFNDLSDQDAKIDALFDYEEPGYATVGPKGTLTIDEPRSTSILRNDLPTPPPTPITPPDSPTNSIPIDAEVCIKVADTLNISSDAEEHLELVLTDDVKQDGDQVVDTKAMESDQEVWPTALSQGGVSVKSATTGASIGVNETTGSFHYKTGWIASANMKVRSVDDYNKQNETEDEVFTNDTPASKQNIMMSQWVLFRKKLNSELIRKLLDPRRAGRSEPTRVYTIDQGTSKFAIFNAKRDRSLQHARALYLDPETYVSMGIPRVRLSSVRENKRRQSQSSPDRVKEVKDNQNALKRQTSGGDADYYSRDEFRLSMRADASKFSAVHTFRSTRSDKYKQDETKRSTESIQLAVDFT